MKTTYSITVETDLPTPEGRREETFMENSTPFPLNYVLIILKRNSRMYH